MVEKKRVPTKKVDTMCVYYRILRMNVSVGKNWNYGTAGSGNYDEVTAAASKIMQKKHTHTKNWEKGENK